MARIRYQLDEHVPNAVAQALLRRGIDAMTASESGVLGMPDAELLARSDIDGRVVVSHDGAFLRLHHRQQYAGIVYAEQGTRTIGQLVAGLVLIYEILEPSEMIGRVEFL